MNQGYSDKQTDTLFTLYSIDKRLLLCHDPLDNWLVMKYLDIILLKEFSPDKIINL